MTTAGCDQQARDVAVDPGLSCIVQAPAGSGKTELLVHRALNLLAVAERPEAVVAITFTRKAAAEMRVRLLGELRAAADDSQVAEHKRAIRQSASQVLARDATLGWSLQRNPDRLQVMTIDGLCQALVRQQPLTAGIGGSAHVASDIELAEIYRHAARNALSQSAPDDELLGNVGRLLARSDNNPGQLIERLSAMLRARDQWLRHIRRNPDRSALEQTRHRLVGASLAQLQSLFPEERLRELWPLARYAAHNADGVDELAGLRVATRVPGSDPEDLAAWQGLAFLLLTQSKSNRAPTWRQRLTVGQGFPASGTVQGQDAKAAKTAFAGILGAFREGEHESLAEALRLLADLPQPTYSDAEWQALEDISAGMVLALAELKLVFAEQGTLDHAEVAQCAQEVLGHDLAPSDLALRLHGQVQHLLVDEFQDTSVTQFALLEQLVAGWAPGDGHSLFLVGDPMQSIYRFREAEVSNFLRVFATARLADVELRPLKLSHNFRTVRSLVEWNNELFSEVFPREQNLEIGAVPFTAAVAARDAPGEVGLHACADASAEAARVVDLARSELAARTDASVAILVHGRTALGEILPALEAADLPYTGVDLKHLGEQAAATDLEALARSLADLDDSVAWLGLLRAPWCGIGLDTLHAVARGCQAEGATVWETLQDGLPETDRDRVAGLVARLREEVENRDERPLPRRVRRAWRRLEADRIYTGLSAQAVELGFDLLEDASQNGVFDRFGFRQRLQEARAASGVQARLQVMTIHKAKGLEFDSVIIPGLSRQWASDRRQLIEWREILFASGERGLLLAPLHDAGGEPDACTRLLRRRQAAAAREESRRLLYVAMTRARSALHLVTTLAPADDNDPAAALVERVKPPRSNTPLALLWESLRGDFQWRDARPEFSSVQPLRLRREEPLSLGDATAVSTRPTEQVDYEWAGLTIRKVGTAVHRLLQWLAEAGLPTWRALTGPAKCQRASALLRSDGVPLSRLADPADLVVAAIDAVLEDPRGCWILQPGHDDAASELALAGWLQDERVTGVIDRTFVDAEGTRWIIDYKTSVHSGEDEDAFLDREQERYGPQLERYAGLMAAREGRCIRLGLYFPLLRGWREWGPGN